jgi:tetratricopeptide (TPR) repeat protein
MAGGGTAAVAWAAVLLGGAGLAVGLRAGGGGGAAAPRDDDRDLLDARSAENRIADLEARLEQAQNRLDAAEGRLGKAEEKAEGALDTARNALRLHGEKGALGVAGGAAPPAEDPEVAARKAKGAEILARIREGRIPEEGVLPFFQEAKDAGVLDEALKEMEAWAKARADDPDAQVDLAQAYIAKLMAVPDGMERGTWSMKSLAACEAALKIQPEHWSAQFVKGMNLSQWPAFLGKQPEAIRTFEKLIEQQERSPPQAEFAQTYFQLGTVYRSAGNVDKAREAFRKGLAAFPEHRALKDQLELLDKR